MKALIRACRRLVRQVSHEVRSQACPVSLKNDVPDKLSERNA